MKTRDVHIGKVYHALVSGNLVRVRIDRESPFGGWEATNLETNRRIRIKTARRLRGEVKPLVPPPSRKFEYCLKPARFWNC